MWFYSETDEILHIQLNFNFKRPKFLISIFTYFYCVKFLAHKFGRVKLLTNLMSDDEAANDDDIVETNLNWSVIRRGGGCLGGILPRVGRRGVRCKMVQSLMRLIVIFGFYNINIKQTSVYRMWFRQTQIENKIYKI